MKYFQHLIITGFLIPFLPINAEIPQTENTYTQSLIAIEEEFSLLNKEFEEFKEDLLSTPEILQTPEITENLTLEVESLEEISSQVQIKVAKEPIAVVDEENQIAQTTPYQHHPATLNAHKTALTEQLEPLNAVISVDLKQAFSGSPIIYSLLFGMSIVALSIWLYSTLSLQASVKISHSLLKNVKNKLSSNHFDKALLLCQEHDNLFCKMIASGIHTRRHGLPVMIESMKAQGKRASIAFWQKIGLLNDIAVIAPMIGLLGTVLGMFYAFYDVNRSMESISVLFDGLGISVGTTVAGLIVAILALILHSTAKYRLVKALALVENEAQSIATLIDDRTSISKG